MTFGSLGAGIGGADLGLLSLGWRLAWQAERDLEKALLLAQRWPDIRRATDIEKASYLPIPDIVHCEPQAPEPDYLWPVIQYVSDARPQGVIIDLASRRAALPLLSDTSRALRDLGYQIGTALLRYQTCVIADGRQHASHVRNRIIFLGTLPPAVPPSDLGLNSRSVLFSGVPEWDPTLPNVAETALSSDVLEQVRLLPRGWTATIPEPARFATLREATVPAFAALCGAALLGQVVLQN